jgi:hypothetical protein
MTKRSLLPPVFLWAACLSYSAFAAETASKPSPRPSPNVYASPVNAGCYIAAPGQCRIHVDPFTINLASGRKLVYFSLLALRTAGTPSLIYNFKPDTSNPVPYTGDLFTPSLVGLDFAATCGIAYTVILEGQDTGDPNPLSLGSTGEFTCPSKVP